MSVPAEEAIPVDTVDAFFVLALVITPGFQVDKYRGSLAAGASTIRHLRSRARFLRELRLGPARSPAEAATAAKADAAHHVIPLTQSRA